VDVFLLVCSIFDTCTWCFNVQVRRNTEDVNYGIFSGHTEEDMKNLAFQHFRKRSSKGRPFKFEWRHVELTMDWPMFVGADIAPATATRSQRPEGEKTSRKRRRQEQQEGHEQEEIDTMRMMRLSMYADSEHGSPRTKMKARKAVHEQVIQDLKMLQGENEGGEELRLEGGRDEGEEPQAQGKNDGGEERRLEGEHEGGQEPRVEGENDNDAEPRIQDHQAAQLPCQELTFTPEDQSEV